MTDPTPAPSPTPTVKAAVATAEAAVKADAESLLTKAKPYLYALGAAVAGFVIGHFVK